LLLPPLHLLLLLQLPLQHLEEQLSLELKTALEMLWQLLYVEQGLGLHLEEAEEAEEEKMEEVEEEEVVVEDNQLLSLHNNLSPSYWPPIYKSWEHFPISSKEKEIRQMPL